jgi:hypothetical protein
MGPLDKFILGEHSLALSPSGFTLSFRSHWYRSLPLSSIGTLRVAVDGVTVADGQMTLEVNGKQCPISQLAGLFNEWWFILDSARLNVTQTPALRRGQRYSIDFTLGLYIPYILVGPSADPVLTTSHITRELACEE